MPRTFLVKKKWRDDSSPTRDSIRPTVLYEEKGLKNKSQRCEPNVEGANTIAVEQTSVIKLEENDSSEDWNSVDDEPLDERPMLLTDEFHNGNRISKSPCRKDIIHSKFDGQKQKLPVGNYVSLKESNSRNVFVISRNSKCNQSHRNDYDPRMIVPKSSPLRDNGLKISKIRDEKNCDYFKHKDHHEEKSFVRVPCEKKLVPRPDNHIPAEESCKRNFVLVSEIHDRKRCEHSQPKLCQGRKVSPIPGPCMSDEISEERKSYLHKCLQNTNPMLSKTSDKFDVNESNHVNNERHDHVNNERHDHVNNERHDHVNNERHDHVNNERHDHVNSERHDVCLKNDCHPANTVLVRKRRSSVPVDFDRAKRFSCSPTNNNMVVTNNRNSCGCSECRIPHPRLARPIVEVVSYSRGPDRCFCKECQYRPASYNEPKKNLCRLPCCTPKQRNVVIKSCYQSCVEPHNRHQSSKDSRWVEYCPCCDDNGKVARDRPIRDLSDHTKPRSKSAECNCSHCQQNDRYSTHNGSYHRPSDIPHKESTGIPRYANVPVVIDKKYRGINPMRHSPCPCDQCVNIKAQLPPLKRPVPVNITRNETEKYYRPITPSPSKSLCPSVLIPANTREEDTSLIQINKENNDRESPEESPSTNKSRVVANWLERKRVAELNRAFETLRKIVPPYGNEDRSLSKIKTLRYAVTYIDHLDFILNEQKKYGYFDMKRETRRLYDIDPLFQKCQEYMEMKEVI